MFHWARCILRWIWREYHYYQYDIYMSPEWQYRGSTRRGEWEP